MRDRITVALMRALLAGGAVGGVAWPALAAPQLTVFGDSYSIPVHDGNRDWPTQLRDRGTVGTVRDFAKSGAVAANLGPNTFARQIRLWNSAGQPLGDTVVYLGYNDIDGRQSLNPSRTGYQAGVAALVNGGATSGGNRLYLVLPHDVGSTPEHNGNASQRSFYRNRTKQWNSFVRSVANRERATVIDVFAAIDRVLNNPGRYGFTNVTTPDRQRSRSTALYDDTFHFGEAGQAIIAQTIGGYLLDEAEAPGTGQPPGLAVLSLDGPAATRLPLDPTRAGFEGAYAPERHEGGIGLEYGLAGGTRLGLAAVVPEGSAALASPAVSAYLRQRLGTFRLDTDLAYGGDPAGVGERTTSLAQRVGLPLRAGGRLTLTPWAGLAYQDRRAGGSALGDPSLGEWRSAEAEAEDVLASLGLAGRLEPVRLGEGVWLTARGGVAYTQGLAGDDYRVRVAVPGGGQQQETVARPAVQAVSLALAGSLTSSGALAVDAEVLAAEDLATGPAGSGRVSLTWHF